MRVLLAVLLVLPATGDAGADSGPYVCYELFPSAHVEVNDQCGEIRVGPVVIRLNDGVKVAYCFAFFARHVAGASHVAGIPACGTIEASAPPLP